MKKKLIGLLSLGIILAIIIGETAFSDPGGRAGTSGSPGEGTCANSGCHDSYSINTGGGSVVISSDELSSWSYTPGETYLINVKVAKVGAKLFGLDFEALQDNGADAGQLEIVNSSETYLKFKTIGANTRTGVVQQKDGGLADDSKTFTLSWTAPETNVGTVTFYVAGNAANDNGSDSGDYIYTASQQAKPASTTGISNKNYNSGTKVLYDIYNKSIKVEFPENQIFEDIKLIIYDLGGRQIQTTSNLVSGQKVDIQTDKFSSGMYFYELRNNNIKMNSGKFIF